MDKLYYDTIDRMEKAGVDRDYITGWATGFLHSPKREQQRATEAYDTGYEHGFEKTTDAFGPFVRKPGA
jgi:hypothetical protein